jgi:hypothetical protein
LDHNPLTYVPCIAVPPHLVYLEIFLNCDIGLIFHTTTYLPIDLFIHPHSSLCLPSYPSIHPSVYPFVQHKNDCSAPGPLLDAGHTLVNKTDIVLDHMELTLSSWEVDLTGNSEAKHYGLGTQFCMWG